MRSACLALIVALTWCDPSIAGPVARPILIGVEYAPPGLGKTFAELGVPAAKHYPDSITWGKMQRREGGPIDFSLMDRFVREYQAAGFRELVLVLKTQNPWASRDARRNFAPKPEHVGALEAWVRAVVERYDGDGRADMPGLRRPVRYYELGSEFSTFEPTPTDDYLDTLKRVHQTAHAAYPKVVVLHAAILATTAFRHHPKPAQYEAAFATVNPRIMHKSLQDIRKILDRPGYFDAVNFHALGDPYEIEDTTAWLRWEMRRRKYNRPILISDTMPAPFIAWGPATRDRGPLRGLGIVVPPAVETDRPRLARYFTKLVEGNAEAEAFNHAFVAADMVKKVVVAAEQGIELINTSFMEDLPLFKTKLMQAGAGTTAWAGMAEVKMNLLTQVRTVTALRPGYYAIARLQYHLRAYDAVHRVPLDDSRARVYLFHNRSRPTWVAWLEPGAVLLPGERTPTLTAAVPARAAGASVVVEKMIDRAGVTRPETTTLPVRDGVMRLTLTPTPVFISPGR